MPDQNPLAAHREDAESVFAEFLCCVEEGGAADIEAVCDEHPALAAELRSLHEGWQGVRHELEQVSPRGASPEDPTQPRGEHWSVLLKYLASRPGPSRYETGEEIGHGGFGVVKKVWDRTLDRSLAMKVLHRDETRNVARFLEEAQITAQLDHPGVVPVHELGIDASRHLYFTMKRVRGESFDRVLEKVFERAEGWTETRALGVLLKACEAVAFAHSRNVIHRDLKPANLMVGRFGETYVMDWGLARVLDAAPEPSGDGPPESVEIRTTRRGPGSGSPLLTRAGDVLGTVNYMAPEQALGAAAGPAADVYSMGAVLYELLARQRPYGDSGSKAEDTLQFVLKGPPRRIAELNPRAQPELVAIAEKAMAREVADRYATMGEMTEDLRAYLEGRVVRAHQTGAFVEFRKWVARNRGTAAALASLLMVTAAAATTLLLQQKAKNQVQATNLAKIGRQADVLLAPELVARAGDLGPIHPDFVPMMDRWLADAGNLELRAGGYREEIEGLRRQGTPLPDPEDSGDPRRMEQVGLQGYEEIAASDAEDARQVLERPDASEEERERARYELRELVRGSEVRKRRIALLEHHIEFDRAVRLAAPELQARHDALAPFVSQLDRLFWAPDAIQKDVERRRELARELPARTVDAFQAEWADATDSIADRDLSPLYEGLEITPQIGLVPLGPDPDTGLWEFWHVLSGERPERDARGGLVIGDDSGMVLVLVPGATVVLGAQKTDPRAPHYSASINGVLESPPHEVPLAPYFLSKYEMTQGQWLRGAGYNPSRYAAGLDYKKAGVLNWAYAVEQVTWEECQKVLRSWDLVLPTEAQWERAARGTGYRQLAGFGFAEAEEMSACGNFMDASLRELGFIIEEGTPNDGFPYEGPVFAFAANDFGFFGMAGNVCEWCLDGHCESWASATFAPDSGEIGNFRGEDHTVRGSGWRDYASQCRVTRRWGLYWRSSAMDVGVRAARRLEVPGAAKGAGSG